MTALCGGGASRIKPGLAEVIVLGSGVMASLLNNRGRFWAAVVAPLVGVISYDALNLCQDDPPAEPTITADDALAILNISDLDAFAAAIAKFRDLIIRAAWFEFCECVAPPQPTLAPLPQPPGWPDLTGVYTPGPAAACLHLDSGEQDITGHTSGNQLQPFGTHIVSGFNTTDLPSSRTDFRVSMQHIPSGASHGNIRVSWTLYNNPPTVQDTSSGFHDLTPGSSFDTGVLPIHAGTSILWLVAYMVSPGSGTTDHVEVVIDVYCGGAPGTGLAPCGPDPLTIGLLLQLVQLTTLIQRQAVPFAYIHGAVHDDLAGDGEISVQGLIGMLVDITALPTGGLGEETGNPDVLFGAGWFNWGNADGFTDRERLSALSQLSLPAAAGQFTRFGYSLPPGLEVRLTELVREA